MRAIMVDSQAARLETCPPNMRGRARLNTNEAAVEYVPKSLTSALEFDRIFSHFASVEIDLGCGVGTFLTAMARENTEHNHLSIGRMRGRVRRGCRNVMRSDISHASGLRMDF